MHFLANMQKMTNFGLFCYLTTQDDLKQEILANHKQRRPFWNKNVCFHQSN
tara:strand:+ start:172 stop:324 length:153 start_codon:yes stop_codon:yes gene_type:complete